LGLFDIVPICQIGFHSFRQLQPSKQLGVRGHITAPTAQEAALPVVIGEPENDLSGHSAQDPRLRSLRDNSSGAGCT